MLRGDFNKRILSKDDCIEDITEPRVAIDLSTNSHREFLRDCKCCVLNGRINPDNSFYYFDLPLRGEPTSSAPTGPNVFMMVVTRDTSVHQCVCVYCPYNMCLWMSVCVNSHSDAALW